MKTISEYITLLSTIKSTMISKLSAHGVNTTGNTMLQMANKIGDIESGIKPNIFAQTTEPETYDGIWIDTDQTVNKLAQVEDFLSEWNNNYMQNMPGAKFAFGSVYYNNKIYVIGGFNKVALNTTYIYDIDGDSWTTGEPCTQANHQLECVLHNGNIYCIGGYNMVSVLNTNHIYNISNNTWTVGAVMTASKSVFGSALHDGKIYCIGGYVSSAVNTMYIYDIDGDSWSTGPVMTGPKYYFGCGQSGGKIYCIGGVSGSALNTNYIYDIANSLWTIGTPMIIYKYGFKICIDDSYRMYCVAGYTTAPIASTQIFSINYTNISVYNSNTLVLQHAASNGPYATILTSSNSFIGGIKFYFNDVAVNGINADIYYGDNAQWIKIKSKI